MTTLILARRLVISPHGPQDLGFRKNDRIAADEYEPGLKVTDTNQTHTIVAGYGAGDATQMKFYGNRTKEHQSSEFLVA